MPDRERELERELRELGAMIDYPPTPDVARSARSLLDEEGDDRPRRFRMTLPALRWAAVAAAFVLVVAVPVLYPGLPDTRTAGGPAVDAGSSQRESEANAPASGLSKGGKAATSPAQTPRFPGEQITLLEAQARTGGALLLPRTPKLGEPDEIYALGTSRKDGVMLVYRAGLPPLGDTGVSLILTEVPGDVEPAYLAGKTAVGQKLDRVMVDGRPGYWSLPARVDRHLLLWEQGGVALRLEANLGEDQAVRIAESVR
jgi:hypothetical protein